ncbi:hypothetical protein H920_11518 [Fukomys damarensis]|uniref:Uncharacterized protein n=1 Tax=Fukomys damarensis TaxID=885580 RepID=A0A091D9E5_FUKDA|nr:hypothetical protein H920_11518 [Fukomys damarensis]
MNLIACPWAARALLLQRAGILSVQVVRQQPVLGSRFPLLPRPPGRHPEETVPDTLPDTAKDDWTRPQLSHMPSALSTHLSAHRISAEPCVALSSAQEESVVRSRYGRDDDPQKVFRIRSGQLDRGQERTHILRALGPSTKQTYVQTQAYHWWLSSYTVVPFLGQPCEPSGGACTWL